MLTPLPEKGNVPPIAGMLDGQQADALTARAQIRQYAKQVRQIRQKCFGEIKVEKVRQQGIQQIREFTDPAAFQPLINELAHEKDDVRLALLDHFAAHGEPGQGALAFMAVTDADPAIRNEATMRLAMPACPPVLRVIDLALRNHDEAYVNHAGELAGALHVTQAIPQLIFAQAAPQARTDEGTGDLAWIAIETQRTFIAGLTPVTGDGSGGFQPNVGVVTEGSVLRIVDAVVVAYRTEVHSSLVALSSTDWGKSTEYLGYDMGAWWSWYNNEYVPYKNAQLKAAEPVKNPPPGRAAEPVPAADPDTPGPQNSPTHEPPA
jgi:hypothetical protein